MRILHLVKTSHGAAWALRQMRELVALGIEIHVALPTNGPLINEYLKFGIKVHDIQYTLAAPHKTFRSLFLMVEKVKPDIIHSHFVLTTLFMRSCLRKKKIPRLFQVPGPLHLEHYFSRNLEIIMSNENDHWAGSCKWTIDRYQKSGIPMDKLFLSYYGMDLIDIKEFRKGALRSELGLKSTDILIGMVAYMYAPKYYLGQFRGIKGHEDFIDAICILQNRYPDIYGVCIGGPWNNAIQYEKRIIKYAKKRNTRIFFLGTRNNVVELYQDLNIAVHPSHSENLGGAPESLYYNVPTITTTVGGFPDLVKNGITGLTVGPRNPEEISKAIEYVLTQKVHVNNMQLKGRKLVKEMMNVRTTARTISEIYNIILNPN